MLLVIELLWFLLIWKHKKVGHTKRFDGYE